MSQIRDKVLDLCRQLIIDNLLSIVKRMKGLIIGTSLGYSMLTAVSLSIYMNTYHDAKELTYIPLFMGLPH